MHPNELVKTLVGCKETEIPGIEEGHSRRNVVKQDVRIFIHCRMCLTIHVFPGLSTQTTDLEGQV